MEGKLLAAIRRYDMLRPGDRLICAVSGGADSMALLWGMWMLREKLQIRVEGCGIRVRLCDHWMNACDEYAGLYANYDFELDARELTPGVWHEVTIAFGDGVASVSADGASLYTVAMKNPAPTGISYLHMQTMAEGTDFRGTLIRRMEFRAK